MKDLEKIKSEDLGCQVQDANPANFAIEQEVAQLVGATVPAPTEPSADDARELGAQLLVFLRRALTPIQTALRTAVAAIYAHLDSRCTDYTPAAYASYKPLPSYDPMGTPPTPRNVANLLTALTAFSARKISDLGDCPDGISFLRMLCDSTAPVTEVKDDNHGWTLNKSIPSSSTYKKVTLNCKAVATDIISSNTTLEELTVPELETVPDINFVNDNTKLKRFEAPIKTMSGFQKRYLCGLSECEEISLPDWPGASMHVVDYFCNNNSLKFLNIPSSSSFTNCRSLGKGLGRNNPVLRRVVVGKLTAFTYSYGVETGCFFPNCPQLIDLEIGAGTAISFPLVDWNPSYVLSDNPTGNDLVTDEGISTNLDQFLQNFREHIALRLAQQPADNPNHLTLTLSQAVFDTIWNADGTPKSTDPDSVIYQINKIIKSEKHWDVNRA